MAGPEPVLPNASPCPRCGGRRLWAVVARRAEYEQHLEIQRDGRVIAASEPVQVDEGPTDEPVYVTCYTAP